MNVLLVGGGGREHALAWKIAQSPRVGKIFCAPGNGGISAAAQCVPIKAVDVDGIVNFAKSMKIDLVVVAPDDPLAAGMVDALESAGIRAFGPVKNAAVIESSKVFAKNLMERHGIPTAKYKVFDNRDEAVSYITSISYPAVVKADGLALGKGVVIARDRGEAVKAVDDMMAGKVFGSAGDRIVIEEYLEGPEVTVLAFTDGKTIVPMLSSQDHKRAMDNDEGPNTGGMGAFSPSPLYTDDISDFCMKNIFLPTIRAMSGENRKFKGVLYFGLILTKEGPKVLEYNARFGDPEAQVVLPLLKTDIIGIIDAIIDERLDSVKIEWKSGAAVCVILASGGYPGKYAVGYEIKGMDEAASDPSIILFHAGTKYESGAYYTSGGRVLGVTAVADSIAAARDRAYKAAAKIRFEGMHYRRDIGVRKTVPV